MRPVDRRYWFRSILAGAIALSGALVVGGCMKQKPGLVIPPRYAQKEKKPVPAVFEGTIFALTDLGGTDMEVISGYGLVGDLRNTGDTTAQAPVRQHIIKNMQKHGYGRMQYGNVAPETALRHPSHAIVRVDGLVPPAARPGTHFDVFVSPPTDRNTTTSLANGKLFQVELRRNGADPRNLGSMVHVVGLAQGPIAVNPAYALNPDPQTPAEKRSLRTGVIMDGGVYQGRRPLVLQLRQPQRSLARSIEYRINDYFQAEKIASAQDEGIVLLYMPESFRGDWQHFAGVVSHLYLNLSTEFAARKAVELSGEAIKPEAGKYLGNISYAWEALGQPALKAVQPLVSNENPDIAFAAARAAAMLGDSSARQSLFQMAQTKGHKFQLNAVQTLGALPPSAEVNGMLRSLMNTDQAMLRMEAYGVLVKNRDPGIFSRVISSHRLNREMFVIDIISSEGPPMIYATRSGIPRIAVFGHKPTLEQPIMFRAMDDSLTISQDGSNVVIFYRGPDGTEPIKVLSRPDIIELIARLGGEGAPGTKRLDFSYSEILGMLQKLADGGKIVASADGQKMAASFVLQEWQDVDAALGGAPIIPDDAGGRPQSTEQGQLGANTGSGTNTAAAMGEPVN